MKNIVSGLQKKPLLFAALVISVIVLVRMIAVIATPLNLGPDEAQYWRWSKELDWGYYSKPPLIAWMISFTTTLFGDSEWAIRFFAPIGHGLAAFFLFILGRHMHDTRTGAWGAAAYMLMPGVSLSSGIISTDGLLLPSWSAAIMLVWLIKEKQTYLKAVLLGLAVGLAFLAKYAASYLLIGIVLTMIFDRDTRKAMLSRYGLISLVCFALTLLPNILWNAQNDFQTVGHTADNANWENSTFNPANIVKFFNDQMGVFGPLSFLLLIGGLAFIFPKTDSESHRKDKWLLCFILPALIVIAGQAFVSRAHANWAASAYPAASILIAAWALRSNWLNALKVGLIINIALGTLMLLLSVNQNLADDIGMANAFKRARGWEASVIELNKAAKSIQADGIIFDERENWHGMDYYGETLVNPPAHYLWQRHNSPHAFAESVYPVPQDSEDVFLVASLRSNFRSRMRADFETFEPVGRIDIDLGGGHVRTFCLHKAIGYHPLDRDPLYEETYRDMEEACPFPQGELIQGRK